MRIRHLGIVVQDLERTAEFYENVLGFTRLGDARTPGHYPGKALDLSDGEVNYSLLLPNPDIERSDWTYGAMGPNHIGVTIEDTGAVVTAPFSLRRPLRISETADRTMLSLMTRTVTVAPLTMSTCG